MSLANAITLARLPLLAVIVGLLYSSHPWVLFVCAWLILILVLMDWFDGYVARMRNEVTDLGSILDIALDRVVENVLWIVFLDRDLVPVWVPVTFLVRSFIIDSMRSYVLFRGQSAFGMMHTRLGKFIVASRFMRASYGAAKVVAFCALALTLALEGWLGHGHKLLPWAYKIDWLLIIIAVGLCVVRGLPVLWDVRAYLNAPKTGDA